MKQDIKYLIKTNNTKFNEGDILYDIDISSIYKNDQYPPKLILIGKDDLEIYIKYQDKIIAWFNEDQSKIFLNNNSKYLYSINEFDKNFWGVDNDIKVHVNMSKIYNDSLFISKNDDGTIFISSIKSIDKTIKFKFDDNFKIIELNNNSIYSNNKNKIISSFVDIISNNYYEITNNERNDIEFIIKKYLSNINDKDLNLLSSILLDILSRNRGV